MKLLFKVRKDQPSSVGVLFDSVEQEAGSFAEYVNAYNEPDFTLKFRVQINNKIDVYLPTKKYNLSLRYLELDYEPVELSSFLNNIKPDENFIFCHFVPYAGSYQMVRYNGVFCFVVSGYEALD